MRWYVSRACGKFQQTADSENGQSLRGRIDPRAHSERKRQVVGEVPGIDSEQHRDFQAVGLFCHEALNHARFILLSAEGSDGAEYDSGAAIERARLPQLHQHPIDSVRALTHLFKE